MTIEYFKEDSEGKWVTYERYLELTELKNKYFKKYKDSEQMLNQTNSSLCSIQSKYSAAKQELESFKKAVRKIANIAYEGKLTNE